MEEGGETANPTEHGRPQVCMRAFTTAVEPSGPDVLPCSYTCMRMFLEYLASTFCCWWPNARTVASPTRPVRPNGLETTDESTRHYGGDNVICQMEL